MALIERVEVPGFGQHGGDGAQRAAPELLDLLRRPQSALLSHLDQAGGEARRPPGFASNSFHDHAGPGTRLRVAPPAGEFFLEEESDRRG
jgi:hypothetical protein